MARQEQQRPQKRGGGFGWLLIGLIVGIVVTVAAFLFLTRAPAPAPAPAGQPTMKMVAPPLPAEPAPVVVAPVAPSPKPAAPARSPSDQVNEDAAATGMTGPAMPPPQGGAATYPTN